MNPGEFREVGHRVGTRWLNIWSTSEEKPVFPNTEPSPPTQLTDETWLLLTTKIPKNKE